MDRLVRLTNALADRVARARTARVTTALGTDMRYELEHPLATMDGVVEKPGDLDAFPPGLFLSVPRDKSASGVAVVDGSITQIGRLSAPVTMSFDNGRLVKIDGGSEATRLSNLLESLEDKNAYEFAAWGRDQSRAALVGEDRSLKGSGCTVGLTSAPVAVQRCPAARSRPRSTWMASSASRPFTWMTS